MRVTESMLAAQMARGSRSALAKLNESIQRLSTNQRISRPSDDPPGARRLVRIDNMVERLDVLELNRNTVRLDLQQADSVLLNSQELLRTGFETAISMANDSVNAQDRASAATVIDNISDQLLSLANRRQPGGNYLFGGVADGTPPFDAQGVYQGSDVDRSVEIAPDVRVKGTFLGDELFAGSTANANVFDVLRGLAEALRSNDGDAIRQGIDDLSDSIDSMRIGQADVGSRLKILDDTHELSDELRLSLQTQRSEIGDLDLIDEITRMDSATNVLETLVLASRQILQTTAPRAI